jgi:hypothetical protein
MIDPSSLSVSVRCAKSRASDRADGRSPREGDGRALIAVMSTVLSADTIDDHTISKGIRSTRQNCPSENATYISRKRAEPIQW